MGQKINYALLPLREQVTAMQRLRVLGVAPVDIARKCGVTTEFVETVVPTSKQCKVIRREARKRMLKEGDGNHVVEETKTWKRFVIARNASIRQLRGEGMSFLDLAKIFDVPMETVIKAVEPMFKVDRSGPASLSSAQSESRSRPAESS